MAGLNCTPAAGGRQGVKTHTLLDWLRQLSIARREGLYYNGHVAVAVLGRGFSAFLALIPKRAAGQKGGTAATNRARHVGALILLPVRACA